MSDRRVALGEIALMFHGLTMNGGFLHSFEANPSTLHDVLVAFDTLQMKRARGLVSAGIALVPGSEFAPPDARRTLINALDRKVAERLEALGDNYTGRVSDSQLGDRIDRFAAPRTRKPRLPRPIPEMLAEYRATLEEHGVAMADLRVAAANRLVVRNHKLMKHLAATDEGRDGIWALREHPDPKVRTTALMHSLQWHPNEAVPLLEQALVDGAWEVRYILRNWRDGKLSFDW